MATEHNKQAGFVYLPLIAGWLVPGAGHFLLRKWGRGALLAAKGRISKSWPLFVWNAFLNPFATFVYNYFFRLGFLDGREGLLLHLNHSVYIHWKFIKAWWIGQKRK